MKHIAVLFASLCVLCGELSAASPPNVIFIFADDQCADTIAALGKPSNSAAASAKFFRGTRTGEYHRPPVSPRAAWISSVFFLAADRPSPDSFRAQ